jgi:PAS domain S-box-containing protein
MSSFAARPTPDSNPSAADAALVQRVEELQERLAEAEETLRALRKGEVDAIVLSGPDGDRVYTLRGAEEPYRAMVQGMAEGACTLTTDGLILFSNEQLAGILHRPLQQVIGSRIQDFWLPADLGLINDLLSETGRRTAESRVQASPGILVPVYLSFDDLTVDGTRCLSLIVTDLTGQKRSEDIVAQERFARSIFEQAGEAILVVNPAGRILRASRAAQLLAGVGVLGRRFDHVFPIRLPDGASHGFAEIQGKTQNGAALEGVEGEILRPDGARVYVRVRAAALANADGSPLATVVTITDFTELRQAEQALRRSEEQRRVDEALHEERRRFNEILDLLPVMVCLLTPDHRLRFANRRFREFFGDPEGQRCYESVSGLSAPCPQCQAFIALQTRAPHRWEFYGETGACLQVYNMPFSDVDGSPLIIEASFDITESKRAEAVLRESEERFRTMADTAPVMIWVSDADRRCTFFNKVWLAFTGRTSAEQLEDGWASGIHPDDLARCQAAFDAAHDVPSRYQLEYRRKSADGSYRWLRSDSVPRFSPNGGFAGYIGSCTDVTEEKRAHEESLARQKLETLGLVAGGVAHDFNNLLGSILANSELAISELPDGSTATHELEQINTVAQRAAEIVRQLLAYAGKEGAAAESVDLSAVVGEMLELLKVTISKRAVVKASLPGDLPPVRANAAQLRQVVMNLVTNASEAFAGRDGVITVATSRLSLSREKGDAADGEFVRLEIGDNGCGMSDEVRARIFDPFFSTKFAGRGLGLAAVQGIIRSHHGSIDVTSVPGQGTRFRILLPSAEEPLQAAPETQEPSPPAAVSRPMTVLVIEDEEPLRRTVAKKLRNRGSTVLEAADGTAGVETFRAAAREIDVVLLDMTLPGGSGADVLTELQQIQPDVKVVLTTAYSQEMVRSALENKEHAGFIRKPYRLAELIACLQEIASRE